MENNYQLYEKDTRPWGEWEVVFVGGNHIIKRIRVNPFSSLSLQLHHHRFEHWLITKGEALVTIGEEKVTLHTYESIDIPLNTKHRLENKTDKPVEFLEVQMGDILDETDIVRFQDIYNRV